MTNLTHEQQTAVDGFRDFLADPDATLFALLGAAGCGKSFTTSRMLDQLGDHGRRIMWCAPTWKALKVVAQMLEARDENFQVGFNAFDGVHADIILMTTQSAMGYGPKVKDNQDESAQSFGRVRKGKIEAIAPSLIIVDEISMVSADELKAMRNDAMDVGAKLLVVGDPNQLPPVEGREIPWDKLPNRHDLTTIMRQSGDSAIPYVAEAIRLGNSHDGIEGPGVEHLRAPMLERMLDGLEAPAIDETSWRVHIAYTNAKVDLMNERVCRALYGHGRHEVREGEVIIAQQAVGPIVNQDKLIVNRVGDKGQWGTRIDVQTAEGKRAIVEHLTEDERADQQHPYNVELRRLKAEAVELQSRFKKGDRSVDGKRRAAWRAFFEHKDQTVLVFSHPFAITSHKSQGSTYREALVNVEDIARFDRRGLYVAVTRPRERLIL